MARRRAVGHSAGTRSRATIVTTQLPVDHWHKWLGDPTVADAILDRLLSRAHRMNLQGESLRPRETVAENDDKGDLPTES